jgi:hypothetical protein
MNGEGAVFFLFSALHFLFIFFFVILFPVIFFLFGF